MDFNPDHFLYYLIIGLLVLLFLKEELMPYIKSFFGKITGTKATDDDKPATRAQMDKLSRYYNHDTTEILRSIDDGIGKVHSNLEKVEDALRELKTQHSEWEKYGIKIRKE